jgi:F-type H+-transporting ATPase subunit a
MVLLFSSQIICEKTAELQRTWAYLEPLVVYIRDEIAIPNIGEKTTKIHELFINDFFLCIVFKYGLTPLVNATGNLTITLL